MHSILQEVSDLGSTDSQYAAITVLRLLSLADTHPDVYARLLRLEDHNEKREKEEEELWRYHQEHIINFLTKVMCQRFLLFII